MPALPLSTTRISARRRELEVAQQRPRGVDQEGRGPVVHQDDREIAHAAVKLASTAPWRKALDRPLGGTEGSLNG